MRVIENITDGMMNKLHTAIRFVSDSIVSGGIKRAMNIENAHFQLQALLKDETKVQAVMNDAMESVDGTAYAYDEAAKAASQFAASGLESGEEMLGALKAITGVAAMTNSEYEGISNIFTTVAGNGRLMGDQLLQLSARGLNAASTIADYFREVRGEADMTEGTIREMVTKGQVSFQLFSEAMTWAFGDSAKRANETFNGALSNMKSALARIGAGFISPLVEQNGELVNLFNALRVQINNIKGALVFDEQTSAISGLAKAAKISNDRLTDMFSGIKQNGSVTIANLNQISKRGVNATVALRDYINGVSNGTIRASYATKTALEELTQGMTVNRKRVRQFVEEGKISLDIFTSAMEKSYGDQKALSKQVTDFVLDGISGLVKGIEEADLTKPIEAFYNGIEIGKNGLKGLYSVVKPVEEAFAEVFLSFSGDDVVNLTSAIEKLTAKMKLSEKGSKNLHDAAKGVFDILKLLTDGLFKLLGVSTSTMEPVDSLTELLLRLLGAFGRGLSTFSQWVRGSTAVAKTFHIFAAGFKTVTSGIKWFIEVMDSVITHVKELEIVTKTVSGFKDGVKDFAKTANESLDAIIPQLKEFKDELKKEIPKKAIEMYLDLSKWLK
ncbi:MAG: hypothetical protein K2H85_11060, partial [Allobaculum sp.]|nr:hypothetical protein [Allobaculum sp.]